MSRESTGLAPAPAIRTKRAAPPLLFPPSPPAPLPSVRRSPPPRTSVVPRAGLACAAPPPCPAYPLDRKSTRLNSSHTVISYAVFCLKKKKTKSSRTPPPALYYHDPRHARRNIGQAC